MAFWYSYGVTLGAFDAPEIIDVAPFGRRHRCGFRRPLFRDQRAGLRRFWMMLANLHPLGRMVDYRFRLPR